MDKKSINIEAILHWDNNSIGMLYENFYPSLVGYSLHITANMTASEDIVQDLFSKILEFLNMRRMAMEMTAAGIDDENVRPTFKPK